MAKPANPDSTTPTLPERNHRLLREIDTCRDPAEDPDDIVGYVVDVMARAFAVDASLLFGVGPASGDRELRAVSNRSGKLSRSWTRTILIWRWSPS